MTMNEQVCPLCNAPANFHRVTAPRSGKRIDCPTCISFFIDSASENYLGGLPEYARTERRQQLSEMAKGAPAGELLVIREPNHEEARSGIEGQTTMMIAEYIAR